MCLGVCQVGVCVCMCARTRARARVCVSLKETHLNVRGQGEGEGLCERTSVMRLGQTVEKRTARTETTLPFHRGTHTCLLCPYSWRDHAACWERLQHTLSSSERTFLLHFGLFFSLSGSISLHTLRFCSCFVRELLDKTSVNDISGN